MGIIICEKHGICYVLMKINLTHQSISIKGLPVVSDQHSISFTSSYTLTTLGLEEITTKDSI